MKTRYFQTGIVLMYIIVTVSPILYVLTFFGAHLTASIYLFMLTAWASFCFFSAYFMPGYTLFRLLNVRKPIIEEEKKLQGCFDEVSRRAACDRQIRLLLEEEKSPTAFALGQSTIVISKGMLEQLSDNEIKAVMAHELGHLISRDWIAGTAFMTANALPHFVSSKYKYLRRSKILRGRVPAGMIMTTIICTGYFFYSEHHILSFAALLAFFYFFSRIEQVFRFFWLMTMRYTEYQQDAFAQRLGYGKELKDALCKMIKDKQFAVNIFMTLQNSTHPIVYNRIRRLEELEGLR